jgi:hypothetical protein
MEMDRIGCKDAVEMGWDGMDGYSDGIEWMRIMTGYKE